MRNGRLFFIPNNHNHIRFTISTLNSTAIQQYLSSELKSHEIPKITSEIFSLQKLHKSILSSLQGSSKFI
jgi:hypothetical protein